MRNIVSYLAFLLFTISCNKGDHSQIVESKLMAMEVEMPASPPSSVSAMLLPDEGENVLNNSNIEIEKKIIKDGRMVLDVLNVVSAKKSVQKLIDKFDSYVQRDDYHNNESEELSQLVIRIPNQNFDLFVNSISQGIGSVSDKNINVNDVTVDYTDVSIRLKNKLLYLEKYRELLNRSSSTKDILEIQEKIRALEEEIEASKGKLRFIDDQVKYSVLNISLVRLKSANNITSQIGFSARFTNSLVEGWNSFVNFLLGIISFWPFLILIPFVIVLWKKIRNKTKRRLVREK